MSFEDEDHQDLLPEGGDDRAIAIIGMAGRFPKARDLVELWGNLRDGVEGISFFSDEELTQSGVSEALLKDPRYVKAGSRLEGVGEFDAEFFGYTAREAEILDPQQRLFLEHCWAALEDAGIDPGRHEGLIGVYAGVAWNTYLLSNLTTHRELFDGGGAFQVFITNDKDFMPTRVSYKLNLKGPSIILQTSCSTSLVAAHLACLSLLNYECDVALVGGVTVKVPQEAGYYYMEGGLASPDGHCRAFDASAAGTIFGSGVGVVVLKRLSEAIEDGDCVRAVIRGSAVNNDGSTKVSYTAPSVEGQAEVVAAAQAVAGVDPRSIGYVEAHGTGTSLGDPIEVTALTKVFRESTEDKGFCALGSIKTNLGHLDAAAGVAGLIKTVLALENGQIPPSLNFETPNPNLDLPASPFFVNNELQDWPKGESPRRAGVSSFGVGGTNAHLILEEAPPREPSGPSREHQLLLISARNEQALEEATDQLASALSAPDAPPLADVAYTLQTGRAVFRHRRALVCQDREQAVAALKDRDSRLLMSSVEDEDPRQRPVVFLFSGQGSQYPGMGRELYRGEAVFRKWVDRCADRLREAHGLDLLGALLAEGDDSEAAQEVAQRLAQTGLTQPALFAVEYALVQQWSAWGVEPAILMGHSIGEIVAACVAGVFTLEEALDLVTLRGSLMQELPEGSMLAVPLPEEEILPHLGADLALAAINEPARCAVSGPEEAIAALEATLTAQGVGSRRLHTSHAFHSAMMDPIVEPFRAAVAKVAPKAPKLPVISNVTGTWLTAEEATDPAYWARHLRSPVRFADGVGLALEDPERVFLEVGPGRTLATLAGRHPDRKKGRNGQPVVSSLRHPQDEEAPLDGALAALGRLWLAGLELDSEAFFGDQFRHRVPLPAYPFQRRRYWIEAAAHSATQSAASPRSMDSKATSTKRPDMADWFYLPSWKPALQPKLSRESPLPAHWLVFSDSAGVTSTLVRELEERGATVTQVRPGESFEATAAGYLLDPEDPEGYAQLLEELEVADRSPEAIVHAWNLQARGSTAGAGEGPTFQEAQEVGFFSLLALVQAANRVGMEPQELVVVGNGLLAVAPGEELIPEKAPLLGLLRVLPQEHPGWRSRVVDLALPFREGDRLVRRLLAEVAAPGDEEVVAYRGRQRFVPHPERVPLPEAAGTAVLRPGGSYLLTGGLEGNGFAFAKLLARTVHARLALVEPAQDSSEAPELAQQERLRRVVVLEELGAEVALVEAEAWTAEGIAAAVGAAEERFGEINGVVHAAGTVGERTFRTLVETGPEQAGWHFAAKADPIYGLERALEERLLEGRPKLDFCVLLSSLASSLGGIAYGSYAGANTFLEAFVREHNHRSDEPWIALSWDVWRFEDEAEQITEIRQDLAALAMSPEEGEAAFLRVLAAEPGDQVLVSTGDLGERLAQRRRRIDVLRGNSVPGEDAGPRESHPRPDLPTSYVAPETEMEKSLVGIWKAFLGFEEVGVEDNFFELGGDSFIAVQVATRVKDELGVDLPVAKLYQGLTVRALAELLERDDMAVVEERAEKLEERRQSMDRRRQFQQRRRSGRKG